VLPEAILRERIHISQEPIELNRAADPGGTWSLPTML
jgi:hypothetical protein